MVCVEEGTWRGVVCAGGCSVVWREGYRHAVTCAADPAAQVTACQCVTQCVKVDHPAIVKLD